MNTGPGRLLIVDDNAMHREMLARRLAKTGHVIGVAESAHNLLEHVAQDPGEAETLLATHSLWPVGETRQPIVS